MENLGFLLLALLVMELRSDKYFSRTVGWVHVIHQVTEYLHLSIPWKNQGRSWLSSGLVRLWEAYAFLLRSLAWLVNKSLCFGMKCWNMPIPWCASLHAQSWCGASFQAGALHSFWLEAHTDSLTGKCLDYVVLRLYAIWVKLNEQHLWHIVFFVFFGMNEWN